MKRSKPFSLDDAQHSGNLKRFIAQHQEKAPLADKDRFNALLDAMTKTPKVTSGTKPK